MASRPVFIDYHSILATFSNALYDMIFKKYWFKSKKTDYNRAQIMDYQNMT